MSDYTEHLISMAGGDGDQLAAIEAPLPDDARMDAYYFGFERTGLGFIDGILSAVAVAGKGSHHTQSWNDESDYGYYANRPGLPDATSAVELIQKAAEVAAENATALLAMVREQRAAIERVEALATAWNARGEHDMKVAKMIKDEYISMEILGHGADMVENARHIRNAIAATEGAE
jgi:hypothetical protein